MPDYKLNIVSTIQSVFSFFKQLTPVPSKPQALHSSQDSDTMDSAIQQPSQRRINPQIASPLFSHMPPEIRNYIFRLVLTSFDDKARPYKKGAYYYRPDHRYAQRIDTTLLLTCRRICAETEGVPARINEHTSWYYRAPPDVYKNGLSMEDSPAALKRRSQVETIHLFTQQFWLERQFENFTKRSLFTNATRLKITLRHSDWWYWESRAPLVLEPKRMGKPSACNPKARPTNPFEGKSWGNNFRNFNGLKEFQLELETVENKKGELDAIVARAPGWEFPLGDGTVLVLDQTKTTRTGWIGYPLGKTIPRAKRSRFRGQSTDSSDIGSNENEGEFDDESDDAVESGQDHSRYSPQQPTAHDPRTLEEVFASETDEARVSASKAPARTLTAKQRLQAAGIKFIDEHLEPSAAEERAMTYYIVTLTWFPRLMADDHV